MNYKSIWGAIVLLTIAASMVQSAEGAASQAVSALDSARSQSEIVAARDNLRRLAATSIGELEAYTSNKSKDPQKRLLVLHMVLDHRSAADGATLLRNILQNDTDARFRGDCAAEWGRRNLPGAKEALKGVLGDPKEDLGMKVYAALGLAEIGDDSGKEWSLKAVLDSTPWEPAGIKALELLKATDVVERLERSSRDASRRHGHGRVRFAAIRVRISGKSEREKIAALVGSIRDKRDSDIHNHDVQRMSAKALADIGTNEAGKNLAELAKDEDPDIAGLGAKGLRIGVERKSWTEKQIAKWMKK